MTKPVDIALKRLGKSRTKSKPGRAPTTNPPLSLMADTLNRMTSHSHRTRMATTDFNIHVSDVMKVNKQYAFCSREYVVSHFLGREVSVSSLSPGFSLLFATGHALHDHVRNQWMRKSEWGHLAWGDWECSCRKLSHTGYRPEHVVANRCDHCRTYPDTYVEVTVSIPKFRIVGHPDFLIKWGKRFIIYEIKTIDRADVDFDGMLGPLGDHTLQACFYYWMLRDMGYNVSANIHYLYVDRSNSKLFFGHPYKEFVQKVGKRSRLVPFIDKARLVTDGMITGDLPDRICTKVDEGRAKKCKVAVPCFHMENTYDQAKKNIKKATKNPRTRKRIQRRSRSSVK